MKDWLTSIVIINLHEDKYMKQAEKWKANSEKISQWITMCFWKLTWKMCKNMKIRKIDYSDIIFFFN